MKINSEKQVGGLTADEVRVIYDRVIQHAIKLGMDAGPFLSCWNEGDWDGCREFDFEPNEPQPPEAGD